MRMPQSLVIPGVVLVALGALFFFVSNEIEVRIGVLPFTTVLIIVFMAGAILSVISVVAFLADRL